MDLAIKGRLAVVGGASQGLGYAIAHRLAQEGAAVALVARRTEALQNACARIREDTGARTVAIQADIRQAADCERIIAEAQAQLGGIDILVNNDGAPPLGRLDSFDDAAWAKAIEQNLMSVVRLSRGALPLMKKAGHGRIINITALSVLQPMAEFGLSVATWAGVLGYAKTLALEVARQGITVNTVCPGRFATSRIAKAFDVLGADGQVDPAAMASMAAQVPVGRIGDPEELAGLVGFLCSSLAGYITGHVFHVDGGRHVGLV